MEKTTENKEKNFIKNIKKFITNIGETHFKEFEDRKNIWWAFLIFFSVASGIFWFLMFLYSSAVNWTNLLFFIWIQLTPLLMIYVINKNLRKEEHKNAGQSLLISKGSVRAFLMLCVILIIIPYVLANSGAPIPIPVPFLVAFSIILVYYEIKPEDVLPKEFIAEIPEKYGTISRMPVLSTLIDQAIEKIKFIKKKLETLEEDVKAAKADFDEELKRLKEIWDKQLNKLSDNIDNLLIKKTNKWEQVGLMGLLIFIAFANIWFIGTRTDPLDALSIASASLLSVVSIAFGINIQKLMLAKLKTPMENVFLEINKAIYTTKKVFSDITTYTKKNLDLIENQLKVFDKKNLLTFFPKDIVAVITVILMTFISGLIILIPAFSANQWLLIGIEFIIGYYFMTKK